VDIGSIPVRASITSLTGFINRFLTFFRTMRVRETTPSTDT